LDNKVRVTGIFPGCKADLCIGLTT